MDDSRFTALKNSLSSVPAKALNYSCRITLSRSLDVKQLLSSKKGLPRDYRGLAELMSFQYNDIKKFERFDEPTMKILEAWESHPDAKLNKLIDFLEDMERYDVIEELSPLLEKDAETFMQKQRIVEIPIQVAEGMNLLSVTSGPVSLSYENQILTTDDLRTGECTMYDAYVSYADEDCGFIKKLADFLESPEIGLKLFIRGRDMLAGSTELDTNIELIKNRCRRMVIILTNNFIHSPHCAFQISFAASLSIEQRNRILVPIVLSPCETPSVLLSVSKIDFIKPDIYEWMWEKLVMSLVPHGKNRLFLKSFRRFPEMNFPGMNDHANLESVMPEHKVPVITFPETVKQLALPLNKSCTVTSVEITDDLSSETVIEEQPSIEDSDNEPNELSCSNVATEIPFIISSKKSSSKDPKIQSKSRSKQLKNTFRSYFKKRQSPSNSSSFSSGATSGFHSESTALEDFNCMNDVSNDTSL